MPATAPAATFWSSTALATALATAVDDALADALVDQIAAHLAEAAAARKPIVLPDVDTLIRQAGIATGPAPADPHTPSPSATRTRTAARLAGRAAWWLIRGAAYVTAAVVYHLARALWHLIAAPATELDTDAPPAPSAPTPVADYLDAVDDTITARGWTQHQLTSCDGAVCVIGAERALLRARATDRATAARARTHLLATIGARSIPAWNDGLTRTAADVHAAIQAAAERARTAGE